MWSAKLKQSSILKVVKRDQNAKMRRRRFFSSNSAPINVGIILLYYSFINPPVHDTYRSIESINIATFAKAVGVIKNAWYTAGQESDATNNRDHDAACHVANHLHEIIYAQLYSCCQRK